MPRFQGDFQAAAREPKLPLDRLIAIGDTGNGDGFRPVAIASQPVPEQLRRPFLDEDPGLEVQAGAQFEVLVRRPGEAVAAPMRAAAIHIQAVAERNVRTVVLADDVPGIVGKVLGADGVLVGAGFRVVLEIFEIFEVIDHLEAREAIGRVDVRAAPARRRRLLGVRHRDILAR